MNHSDILVPVNLDKPSYEGLEFAASAAGEMPVRTTLLYVVELNIFPLDRRVYDELCLEYHKKLGVLAQRFFDNQSPRLSVRIGKPHEQILAEAKESQPELIVMSVPANHHRRWSFRPTTVERVVRDATCLTLVLSDPTKITPDRIAVCGFRRRLQSAATNWRGNDCMTENVKTAFDDITCFRDVPEHHDDVEPTFAPELRPGHVLDGRFLIGGTISRSGMATIYQAQDTSNQTSSRSKCRT